MVAQPAKKPIVPNGNAVYPSTILLQSTLPQTPKPDPMPLSSMDVSVFSYQRITNQETWHHVM